MAGSGLMRVLPILGLLNVHSTGSNRLILLIFDQPPIVRHEHHTSTIRCSALLWSAYVAATSSSFMAFIFWPSHW
jgi:hypothetical protein